MNKRRILIVDDNPTNIAILEEILCDHFSLEKAGSGEEAITKGVEFRPELVLLDIMMPGMNGYEACRKMRATPVLRHSKIIMVSAKAMVSERLAGYEAGADDYIAKPFDEEELLAKVKVYLKLSYLEEVDKLKTAILTVLNHETRTPLNNIIPVIELMLEEGPMDPEEHNRWLTMMRKHAERLYCLLDKGIRLSAMKCGAWRFNFQRADLCAVMREVIAELSDRAATRRIKIQQKIPESANAVFDADQIRSAISALLDNALRFSPDGGQIYVSIHTTVDVVHLTITDEGPGIAPELRAGVFDEFGDADALHHTGGQRLSQALAREIVRAHEGEIALVGAEPGATTFSLALPNPGADERRAVTTDVELALQA